MTTMFTERVAPPTVEDFGDRRCVGCGHLQRGAVCRLRSVRLSAPQRQVCVDQDEKRKRGAVAVGPIYELGERALSVAVTAPDSLRHRDELIDTLERVATSRLSLRERVAVEEAERLGERRTIVHLDRIAKLLEPRDVRVEPLGATMHALVGEELRDERRGLFLENFTWQGRALIFACLTAGCVLTWGSSWMLSQYVLKLTGQVIAVSTMTVGTPLGAVLLKVGIAVFRRRGIPFRVGAESR